MDLPPPPTTNGEQAKLSQATAKILAKSLFMLLPGTRNKLSHTKCRHITVQVKLVSPIPDAETKNRVTWWDIAPQWHPFLICHLI